MPEVTLFVSIDTEEDDWFASDRPVTVENIRRLPRFVRFLDSLGARPTFLVTHQVASVERSAQVIREVAGADGVEIGAHLHPWNTPPIGSTFDSSRTMLANLSFERQLAKLVTLTDTLGELLGNRPISFRAGRYGLNADTVRALLECGYAVDASVTPFTDWRPVDDGPNLDGAPLACYRIDGTRDVRQPSASGLVEVPLSIGFNRRPFAFWKKIHDKLATPGLKPLRLLGIAGRSGLLKRLLLSPEFATASEMLALSRQLLAEGTRHLQLWLHSPSLTPGLTPYTSNAGDVDRLYGAIESYLERLSGICRIRFATLAETRQLLSRTVPAASSNANA